MKNNIKFLNLTQDPFDLFAEWFSLAEKKEINDPNAMNLSTLDSDLQPSSRIVLMKSNKPKPTQYSRIMRANISESSMMMRE